MVKSKIPVLKVLVACFTENPILVIAANYTVLTETRIQAKVARLELLPRPTVLRKLTIVNLSKATELKIHCVVQDHAKNQRLYI